MTTEPISSASEPEPEPELPPVASGDEDESDLERYAPEAAAMIKLHRKIEAIYGSRREGEESHPRAMSVSLEPGPPQTGAAAAAAAGPDATWKPALETIASFRDSPESLAQIRAQIEAMQKARMGLEAAMAEVRREGPAASEPLGDPARAGPS